MDIFLPKMKFLFISLYIVAPQENIASAKDKLINKCTSHAPFRSKLL